MPIEATPISYAIPTPEDSSHNVGWIICRNGQGQPQENVTLELRLISEGEASGSFSRQSFSVTSDADGIATAQLVIGATYAISRDSGRPIEFVVPEGNPASPSNAFELPNVLGGTERDDCQ